VGPFCPSPTKGSMLHFKISEKIESKVYHCAVFKLLNFYSFFKFGTKVNCGDIIMHTKFSP